MFVAGLSSFRAECSGDTGLSFKRLKSEVARRLGWVGGRTAAGSCWVEDESDEEGETVVAIGES